MLVGGGEETKSQDTSYSAPQDHLHCPEKPHLPVAKVCFGWWQPHSLLSLSSPSLHSLTPSHTGSSPSHPMLISQHVDILEPSHVN